MREITNNGAPSPVPFSVWIFPSLLPGITAIILGERNLRNCWSVPLAKVLTCCDRPHRERRGGEDETLLISDPWSDSWLPQEDTAWGVSSFDPLRVLSGMHTPARTRACTHITDSTDVYVNACFHNFSISTTLPFSPFLSLKPKLIHPLTQTHTHARTHSGPLAHKYRSWHELPKNTQPFL